MFRAETRLHIRPEVIKFAEAMENELRVNGSKGYRGWKDMTPVELLSRVEDELKELKELKELSADAPDSIMLGEAADAANFLMMLCDVCGLLTPDSA